MSNVQEGLMQAFDATGGPQVRGSPNGAKSSHSCLKTTGGAPSKQGRTMSLLLCLLHQWLSHHSLNKYSLIKTCSFYQY